MPILVAIPSNRVNASVVDVHEDEEVILILSQSPLIGSMLPSVKPGLIINYVVSRSQSPLIGSMLPSRQVFEEGNKAMDESQSPLIGSMLPSH